MEPWTYINDHMIRISYRENGLALPICEDVFEAVGLAAICTKTGVDTFYDLISQDPELAVKFTSYECDTRQDKVIELLRKYFLIDLGIRLEYTNDKYLKHEEFIIAASNIGGLYGTWLPKHELLKMLAEEGFEFELNSF